MAATHACKEGSLLKEIILSISCVAFSMNPTTAASGAESGIVFRGGQNKNKNLNKIAKSSNQVCNKLNT